MYQWEDKIKKNELVFKQKRIKFLNSKRIRDIKVDFTFKNVVHILQSQEYMHCIN